MPEIPELPPIADAPLSVVLLLTRPQPELQELIAGWAAFLEGLHRPYEILLVVDGVADAALAAALGQRFPCVRVLHTAVAPVGNWPAEAHGEGAALRTALAEACHPLLFYTLCDPRYHPADLGKLLGQIDRVHLVGGYRAGRRVPLGLRLLGALWRACTYLVVGAAPPPLPGWLGWRRHAGAFLARFLFGVRYRDPACPFRLARREILASIPLQSSGPFVHVEILAKANFLTCMLGEEVPLGEPDRPVLPEESLPALGPLLKEAQQVFRQPTFCPPPPSTPPDLPSGHPPVLPPEIGPNT